MRLLAYCVMPNHFHLVVWPRADGDLTRFMAWLTMTHTQRWHAHRHTAGTGHLYQGRYKSFPVESDEHVWTVCRYVERNALRAGLVDRAKRWRWCGLYRRMTSRPALDAGPALAPGPRECPPDWAQRVNAALSPAEEEAMRRGQPFGSPGGSTATAARLGLLSTVRPRGRPRKGPIPEGQGLLFQEGGC
jgi:putative transposase